MLEELSERAEQISVQVEVIMSHVGAIYEYFGGAYRGIVVLATVMEGDHLILATMKDECRTARTLHLIDVVKALRNEKTKEASNVITSDALHRGVARHNAERTRVELASKPAGGA